jgi:sigma-B regulation protein RsbU (phosphoserine phosphatase)
MPKVSAHLRLPWRGVSRFDIVAIAAAVVGLLAAWAGPARRTRGVFGLLEVLGILAGIYLAFRLVERLRGRILWSLRNRLLVAYVFIAVVPVLLLLTLGILGAQLLYSQLGTYVVYQDLQRCLNTLDRDARQIAAVYATLPTSFTSDAAEGALEAQADSAAEQDVPGRIAEWRDGSDLLRQLLPAGGESFNGVVQSGRQLELLSVHAARGPRGHAVVRVSAAVTPALLEEVAPALGPVQVVLTAPYAGNDPGEVLYKEDGRQYRALASISTRHRVLHGPSHWFDRVVGGYSKLGVNYLQPGGRVVRDHPAFVVFSARTSDLNRLLFSSLGDLSNVYVDLFVVVAVVFLMIELAALFTGVVLTRRITRAAAELYRATQHVQAGDFGHRVRIERRDQLGALGESFNHMTSSVAGLVEEQKRRQRLENEISIAREVQTQLFPRELPKVAGVELEATCRAARAVSGDYYDFVTLGPTQVAVAIADISGKGISAALLMASLQAALRSQVLASGTAGESTAEMVARLNRHLVRNTSEDRFATFFYAVYDGATHRLRYTNAGHVPSLLIWNGGSRRLAVGGTVLGVVEDCLYEQESLEVPSDSLLIGYSDGLVEPENVYGEEFGIDRLEEAALRLRAKSPRAVAEALLAAVDEWAAEPEQADDMTVIVARLS